MTDEKSLAETEKAPEFDLGLYSFNKLEAALGYPRAVFDESFFRDRRFLLSPVPAKEKTETHFRKPLYLRKCG